MALNTQDAILLVEDSGDDIALMRYAFRKAGVPNLIFEVHDGEEAIDYLKGAGRFADREQYPLPCLIITDLKMPKVNGFELLEWLCGQPEFSRVPKLVLSSSAIEADKVRAAKLGAGAYFVKPNDIQELVKVVLYIDEEWISEHCPLPKASSS